MTVVLPLLLVAGVLLSIVIRSLPSGLSQSIIIISASGFLLAAVFRLTKVIEIGSTRSKYLRADAAFLLFFYVLYVHPYVLDLFGIIDSSYNRFIPNSFFHNANQALATASVAVISFCMGFGRGEGSKARSKFLEESSSENVIRTFLVLNLVFGYIALAIFILTGGLNTLSGEYTGLASGNVVADGLNFIVGHFAAVILAVAFVIPAEQKALKAISIVFPVFWSLVLLGSGDRNSFLLVAATGLVAFSISVKPIGLSHIILLALLSYPAYNAIEYARSSGERSVTGVLSAIIEGKSETTSFDESSFSLTTLNARASMEDMSDFAIAFGEFKLIGFAGVVPLSRKLLVEPGEPFVSSSDVLSEIIIGPARTWSIGSGVFLDIIVDLGLALVPLVMYAVGYVGGRVQGLAALYRGGAAVILFSIVTPLYLEYPRYTIDFPVRNIVWTLLFFYVSIALVKWNGESVK